MSSPGTLLYPNQLGRIMFMAMDEILGLQSVQAVLTAAGLPQYIDNYPPFTRERAIPFAHISAIQAALESEYGARAGRGLALRVGRASFKYGLQEFGAELGMTSLSFRLLPLPKRIKKGLESLAAMFNDLAGLQVRLEVLEGEEALLAWVMAECPLCHARSSETPVCTLAVGFLQEALTWIGAGRLFRVEEKTCRASGGRECKIVIDSAPMG